MTTPINPDAIDVTFPIPGQDNDSNVFRENYVAIYNALAAAKENIEELQSTSVLKADLATNTTTVDNDLNWSKLSNGLYSNFHGITYSSAVVGNTDVDVRNGDIQVFTFSADSVLTFKYWPVDVPTQGTPYTKIKLHLLSDTVSDRTISFATGGGTIKYESEFPTSIVLRSTSEATPKAIAKVVEAWSYNGGTTVFLKYLGEYSTASNDKSITGALSVTGTTTLTTATAVSLTVSNTSVLGAASATTLSVTALGSFTGDIAVGGNSTLGNNRLVDLTTFNSIPIIPSFTTSEREALTASRGMLIFNSTTGKAEICTVPGIGILATWVDLN